MNKFPMSDNGESCYHVLQGGARGHLGTLNEG